MADQKSPEKGQTGKGRAKKGLPDLVPPALGLGVLIHDIAQMFWTEFERRMTRLGLSNSQWRVMSHLALGHDGSTQRDLAALLQMEPSPMGRLLDGLEDLGLIERRPDPNDGRAWRIHRARKFELMIPRIAMAMNSTLDAALGDMPDKARRRLMHDLTMVRQNLRNMGGEAPVVELADLGLSTMDLAGKGKGR